MTPIERTVEYHEARVALLEGIAERQQTLLEGMDTRLEEMRAQTAEGRRKADAAQCLWVYFARKFGWPEEWLLPEQE